MTLPVPNLDDRTFQDLVREARARIPRYCPEWTDHNLSDPGITLIELFAWMVDTLLYRLNKVPDKNYIKFMELIGVHLEPPKPAKADVTFRLSAPQPAPVTVPHGTEVATVRTETQDAITFTTDEDLTIIPPVLEYALTTSDDVDFEECMTGLKNPDRLVTVFQDIPQENNAFYLGFSENLKAQTVALSLKCRSEGIGIDPNDPPLQWEYWDGNIERWIALRVEKDSTGGMNTNGQVILHVPYGCAVTEVHGQSACWLRCRVVETRPGQRAYNSSPRILSLSPDGIGGTVLVSHALRITNEFLGKSNGAPGQKFFLQNAPVLKREPRETITVEKSDGEVETWHEVENFSSSGPDEPHFTCDSMTGEVQFGPSIKQPSGQERQYGRVPEFGSNIYFMSYRYGGGTIGNVGPSTITIMKSSIPYIASVTNWSAATGGTEAETIESAKMRAPQVLKARTRAVTSDDFECLAVQASTRVARAKCLTPGTGGEGVSPEAGVVRLMLVPVVSKAEQLIPKEELELTRQIREEVEAYLDERRLLGTRLEIVTPKYVPVAVEAKIRGRQGTDFRCVADEIERALYRYINPLVGGSEGNGWPFGRGISLSEVYAAIHGMGNFDFIENVNLYPVDPVTGERQGATTQISVTLDSLICSHKHEITVS
ncbi:MAG: putative baseplate assembly protein [Chloroflexota bacterium]|nr:putative baseplate assembly protein [Chloroflexota bacterium]